MNILQILLIVVHLKAYYAQHTIEVTFSGIKPLSRDSIAMIFYVTVLNKGHLPQKTTISVIECCEKISETGTDCNTMNLFGGDMGAVQVNSTVNLKLIFPNFCSYNRKGICPVNIWHSFFGSDQKSD